MTVRPHVGMIVVLKLNDYDNYYHQSTTNQISIFRIVVWFFFLGILFFGGKLYNDSTLFNFKTRGMSWRLMW